MACRSLHTDMAFHVRILTRYHGCYHRNDNAETTCEKNLFLVNFGHPDFPTFSNLCCLGSCAAVATLKQMLANNCYESHQGSAFFDLGPRKIDMCGGNSIAFGQTGHFLGNLAHACLRKRDVRDSPKVRGHVLTCHVVVARGSANQRVSWTVCDSPITSLVRQPDTHSCWILTSVLKILRQALSQSKCGVHAEPDSWPTWSCTWLHRTSPM